MKTDIRILSVVVDKLQERYDKTEELPGTFEKVKIEKDELRQDIKYSIDMLNTIIEIEEGESSKKEELKL